MTCWWLVVRLAQMKRHRQTHIDFGSGGWRGDALVREFGALVIEAREKNVGWRVIAHRIEVATGRRCSSSTLWRAFKGVAR